MSNNNVRSALELVDAEPSHEFLSSLRTRLLADFTRSDTGDQGPNVSPSESGEECIALVPKHSRFGPSRRLLKAVLATAACGALFATGAVIVSRAGHNPNATTQLHDVNRQEALPLAQHALITTDALGIQWTSGYSWDESDLPIQAAATIAALPACALLRSVGLFPPTTKSATAHQYVSGSNYLFQQVYVFSTPEDASRAMDVIASDLFPSCWFNLFDRLTPLGSAGSPSASEAWDIPHVYGPLEPFEIAPHGDRQIIIGQHTTVIRPGSPLEQRLRSGRPNDLVGQPSLRCPQ